MARVVHYAYMSSLPEHCYELLLLAKPLLDLYPQIDRDLLVAGILLHDIGKMGMPASILPKPGALSEDEWGLMRCEVLQFTGLGFNFEVQLANTCQKILHSVS